MREATPQYAVVDLRMPGGSGLDLVRSLRALAQPAQVVVLTGYGTIGTAVEAIRLGAINYLNKPADADEIEARSEEHTSELQSQSNLVCRLLLEKKKKKKYIV